jgi:hypothetical protein
MRISLGSTIEHHQAAALTTPEVIIDMPHGELKKHRSSRHPHVVAPSLYGGRARGHAIT